MTPNQRRQALELIDELAGHFKGIRPGQYDEAYLKSTIHRLESLHTQLEQEGSFWAHVARSVNDLSDLSGHSTTRPSAGHQQGLERVHIPDFPNPTPPKSHQSDGPTPTDPTQTLREARRPLTQQEMAQTLNPNPEVPRNTTNFSTPDFQTWWLTYRAILGQELDNLIETLHLGIFSSNDLRPCLATTWDVAQSPHPSNGFHHWWDTNRRRLANLVNGEPWDAQGNFRYDKLEVVAREAWDNARNVILNPQP
jgi:hypothetical protein